MKPEKLDDTWFYAMEKAIKAYRQFAQRNLVRAGFEITVDQWLILRTIQDNPDMPLAGVAAHVFKDVASITRIVQLLETGGYVKRRTVATDKRRASFALTAHGKATIRNLQPVINRNRRDALKRISTAELRQSQSTFDAVFTNCHPETSA